MTEILQRDWLQWARSDMMAACAPQESCVLLRSAAELRKARIPRRRHRHRHRPTSSPTNRRRVVQLATGITSIARVGRVGVNPREEVGVGVGVVECELKKTRRRSRETRHCSSDRLR